MGRDQHAHWGTLHVADQRDNDSSYDEANGRRNDPAAVLARRVESHRSPEEYAQVNKWVEPPMADYIDAVRTRIGDRPLTASAQADGSVEIYPLGRPYSLYRFAMNTRFPKHDGKHYQPLDHLDDIVAAVNDQADKAHPRLCCPLGMNGINFYICRIHGGGDL